MADDEEPASALDKLLILLSVGMALYQVWVLLPEHRKELAKMRLRQGVHRLVAPLVAMRIRRSAQAELSWEVFLALGELAGYDSSGDDLGKRLELA